MTANFETRMDNYMLDQRDGLIDLATGLVIAFFGLGLWIGMPWLTPAPVLVPLLQPLKEKITAPRLSRYERSATDSDQRPSVILKMSILLVFLACIGVVALLLVGYFLGDPRASAWLHLAFDGGLGILGAITLGILGLLIGNRRFLLYAAVGILIFAGGYLLAAPFWLSIAVWGSLVSLAGALVFARFLRQYPG